MIALGWPTLPFNPVTVPIDQGLTLPEVLAGPLGLILFIVLVPFVRLAARWRPAAAIIVAGVLWHTFTAGPWATLVVAGGLLVGCGWISLLGRAVAAGRLAPRTMIALVWIGLTLLVLPLWWQPTWSWYGWVPLRPAPLHFLGIAYFYLRLVAWGMDLADQHRLIAVGTNHSGSVEQDAQTSGAPDVAPAISRWLPTVAWLAYPPVMRLGPVMLRQEFLARFDAWDPRAGVPWRRVGRRAGLFVLGGIALAVLSHNLPHIPPGTADFFARPDLYRTDQLIGLVYGLPIQIYLLLWCYNELAAVVGLLVGIEVDNNFAWLPRAASVKDFWHRWHVTVGRWLRNYVYIPFGGNRGAAWLHTAAVFGFCAVWHGPSWSFLVWGASQVLALMVQGVWERFADGRGWAGRRSNRAWVTICWLVTMQYQVLTITMFLDFEHAGWRVLGTLAARASG